MVDGRQGCGRRDVLKAVAGAVAASALPVRAQKAFPDRPLKVIVGLPPGGAADVIVRAFTPALEQSLKQPVIVENRPGGQFQISMQALANAPADGHTLLYLYSSYPAVQAVQKLFDLERQVQPLTMIVSSPIVLLVRGDSPYRTMGDLVRFGQKNPGKLTYGTFGAGSLEHLKLAQIERIAGFTGTPVPYKGGPDVLKALLGGEVDFGILAGIFAKQFVPSGQARALAVLESRRWSDFPDLPTFAEAGVAVPPMSYWGGFAVRAGTPPDVAQRLYRELQTAAGLPAVQEKISGAGASILLSRSADEFRGVIADDLAWMGQTARNLDLRG